MAICSKRSICIALFGLLLVACIIGVLVARRVEGRPVKSEAAHNIGVCYGLNGDNLPSPEETINLYKKYGVTKMRLYEPNTDVLEALQGKDIDLILGVKNQDIPTLASSESAADSWFVDNLQPYVNGINIPYIAIGNEVVPGEFSESLVLALQNLQNVVSSHGLGSKVTTVVHSGVLANSCPPSAATFSSDAQETMGGIVSFLSSQNSPLLVNLYPYFAYASDPKDVRLDYAQFSSADVVVRDGSLNYMNLFDAMVDAFFWAMEKSGAGNVDVVVSESGWPHAGNGDFSTPDLAATYNKNYMMHVNANSGTPKRPDASIEGYIFAMFDENLKQPAGVEQNWGILKPNMEPNYDIFS